MIHCILCNAEVIKVNYSLCSDCELKLKLIKPKVHNWPFPQSIRFNN
jgi:hypothetical protein